MMKKLLNLLTMLLLLVVSQEMMGKTIYFYNDAKWDSPNVYMWEKNTKNENHVWPGVVCSTTTLTPNAVKVYKIDIDNDNFNQVVFNIGSDAAKTTDQDLIDGAYYNSKGLVAADAISFYFVGGTYNASGTEISSNWNDLNVASNAKYKLMRNENVYSYSITCTESSQLRFRLRKPATETNFNTTEYGPSETKSMETAKSYTLGGMTSTAKSPYLSIDMQAGYVYTIVYDALSGSVYYESTPTDPASYELVVKSQTSDKVFKMPMSQTRHRDSNSYNMNLWTAGFKSDLLPVDGTYDIYIKKTTEKSNAVTYLYPNPTASLGVNQVSNWDYTNLKSVENIVYLEGSQPICLKKLTVKKGEASSFTVALNLGGKIEKGNAGNNDMMTFAFAANSMSLYKNNSISAVYEAMYGDSYKKEAEDYYLIGQLDGSTYVPKRTSETLNPYTYTSPLAYKNTYLMERRVFYNPITAAIDSVVYSKVVKKTESGFNQLFLSFAPRVLLENAEGKNVGNQGPKYWGNIVDNKNGAVYNNEAWNYIVRPEVFDEQDATAQMGAVYFLGSSTLSEDKYDEKTKNGNQALNPLVLNSADYDYYIVRLNVTTSTYRIEFVKKEKIKISVDGIRTYCGQTSLRIPTNDTKGLKGNVHFYAVQSYEAPKEEVPEYKDKQGTLQLRALNYIPANEPIVLVVDHTTVTTLENTTDENGKTTYWLDLEVMYDTDADYTAIKQEWWKNYDTADGYRKTDPYFNYLKGNSMEDIVIPNGIYTIENGKYKYAARNFALNRFFNTNYFNHVLTEEERAKLREDEATNNYFSFFRAKGRVSKGNAYLQLPSSVMNFDGQLLDHVEDDNAHFAKMNLVFDDIEGDVTGIEEMKTSSNASVCEDGAYYTLQGLKVEKPTKGLYIHNGKKVIIK